MFSVDLPEYLGRSFCVRTLFLNREHMFAILGSSRGVTQKGGKGSKLKKMYVQVDSERMENGEVVPLAISWTDGRVWRIDRVIHSCASPDREFDGIRYTVMIGSAEKYIYRVGHAWYVMA